MVCSIKTTTLVMLGAMLVLFPDTAAAVYQCGGQKDDCECGKANPFPCCDCGNCTWWAWEGACCGWGVAVPTYGDAKDWLNEAQAAGWPTTDTPHEGTVFVRTVGQWGHVGWIISASGGSFTSTEEACWGWCGVATYSHGPGYAAGFICKKGAGCGAPIPPPCTPNAKKQCDGGDVWWFNSCGEKGGKAEDCNDDNACTSDGCDGDHCTHAQNKDCNDSNKCTDDSCNKTTGNCEHPPHNCDDGNLCTDDSCEPATGCHYKNNSLPCDDQSVCSTVDQCVGGSCTGIEWVNCDDQNVCTDDPCDPKLGCQHPKHNCDEGDFCTEDPCIEPEMGCQHYKIPNCCHSDAECDDGLDCSSQWCDQGKHECLYDVPAGCCKTDMTCNDGVPCTKDACIDQQCVHLDVPGAATACVGNDLHSASSCGVVEGYLNSCAPCPCVGDTCVEPQCSGKQCGDDGCGGSCGECLGGMFCDPFGLCSLDPGDDCPMKITHDGANIVDDLKTCFKRHGEVTAWAQFDGGYANHFWYLQATSAAESLNYGIWVLDVAEAGDYLIEVYIPETLATTEKAVYVVRHSGADENVVMDQSSYPGEWAQLGVFTFGEGGEQYLRLGESTGEKWNSAEPKTVAFDAIRLKWKPQCLPVCLLPDGSAKACGDDGCGGSCGECAETHLCTSSGLCVPADLADCEVVPESGTCAAGILYWCDDGAVHAHDCTDDGLVCSYNALAFGMTCVDNVCIPHCDVIECGDDGCGGSCGSCPKGESCVSGECAVCPGEPICPAVLPDAVSAPDGAQVSHGDSATETVGSDSAAPAPSKPLNAGESSSGCSVSFY